MGGNQMKKNQYESEIELPTMPSQQSIEWVLPVLKEYSEKLLDFCQRSTLSWQQYTSSNYNPACVIDFGAQSHWFTNTYNHIYAIARHASGLLEHSASFIEHEFELELRCDEIESRLKTAEVIHDEIRRYFQSRPKASELLHKVA
jgi:hypothetical protein